MSCFDDISIGRSDNILHGASSFDCGGGLGVVQCIFRGGFGLGLSGSDGLSLGLGIRLESCSNPASGADSLFNVIVRSGPISFPMHFPSSPGISCVH